MAQTVCGWPSDDRRACRTGLYLTPKAELSEPSREGLLEAAKGSTNSGEVHRDLATRKPREEAPQQVVKGWLEGPFKYTSNGLLAKEGRKLSVNPLFVSGCGALASWGQRAI